MKHSEGKFTGAVSLELYYQCWQPDGQPRAVVVIVHGIGEHSGRYMNVVNQLAPHGYGADRIVSSAGSQRFFEAVPLTDKELHIYPDGYHEPHNDLQHEQVTANLENWLERHL